MAASIKSRSGLIFRLANSVLKPPQNYLVTNLLYPVALYAGLLELRCSPHVTAGTQPV